jgi:YidC/Oxa1 family membrane protein insertase
MEQARLFIAIGISFAIFFLWSMFFAPTPQETPTQLTQDNTQAQNTVKETPAEAAPEAPAPAAAPETVVRQTSEPARAITVETPLFRMMLSERGATIKSVVLKQFREALDPESPLKEMIDDKVNGGSIRTTLSSQGLEAMEQAVFSATATGDTLSITTGSGDVRFQYQAPNGVIVEKKYTFYPDTYLVDLSVDVYNGTEAMLQGSLGVALQNIPPEKAGAIGFEGPSGLIADKLQQIKIKDIEKYTPLEGPVQWIAIEKRYFMISLIPVSETDGKMVLGMKDNTIQNKLVTPIGEIGPEQRKTFDYKLFMGPKSLELLKSYNLKLDQAINFGWFDFLAKPCLWFMNFIYRFIPNYGIAIIILTIVTRALFWPLAKKSYKSMGEMRKIQPLMQEVREKYKDDKTRQNQEMMTLYKTYKINPMGGCLPMLIQLPVFFALYRMLYQAIELRHAPFFGWIDDLSAPDRLFELGFKIPFMEPPYGIPVLTLVMGASMLLQQKMTPTPGDPAQAKMMMLMPVVFTFIFINFSSGLVLYWLVSNIFSMAQQYYTQKSTA